MLILKQHRLTQTMAHETLRGISMFQEKIFEPIGYIIGAATFLFSLFLFYSDTSVFWGSFAAALIAAGLIWVSYVILRIFFLALRR